MSLHWLWRRMKSNNYLSLYNSNFIFILYFLGRNVPRVMLFTWPMRLVTFPWTHAISEGKLFVLSSRWPSSSSYFVSLTLSIRLVLCMQYQLTLFIRELMEKVDCFFKCCWQTLQNRAIFLCMKWRMLSDLIQFFKKCLHVHEDILS